MKEVLLSSILYLFHIWIEWIYHAMDKWTPQRILKTMAPVFFLYQMYYSLREKWQRKEMQIHQGKVKRFFWHVRKCVIVLCGYCAWGSSPLVALLPWITALKKLGGSQTASSKTPLDHNITLVCPCFKITDVTNSDFPFHITCTVRSVQKRPNWRLASLWFLCVNPQRFGAWKFFFWNSF